MTDNILSFGAIQKVIFEQYQSERQFPVDFEEFSTWLGFSRKDSAKRAFMNSGFEENTDFELHISEELRPQGGFSNRENIYLTIDCAKSFAMMARTEQGKMVRKWYLDIEKQWRCQNQKPVQKKFSQVETIAQINQLKSTLEYFGFDINNPRYAQSMQDLIGDALGLRSAQILSSQTEKEIWLGVAERAEQLGYPTSLVVQNRIKLGKYVASCGLSPRKEQRLCNGTFREINLYRLTERLDKSIIEFMDAKVLAQ